MLHDRTNICILFLSSENIVKVENYHLVLSVGDNSADSPFLFCQFFILFIHFQDLKDKIKLSRVRDHFICEFYTFIK